MTRITTPNVPGKTMGKFWRRQVLCKAGMYASGALVVLPTAELAWSGGYGLMDDDRDRELGGITGELVALQPRLLRFAHSLTHDHEAAADLAQETIARALASRAHFQPGTNLKAWLFRIMRNLHLNAVRAAGVRRGVVSIEELVTEPAAAGESAQNPVEASVIERADLRRLIEAYRTLPPTFAIPIYLTAVEEMSYAQVASVLDIPVGTVMSRIYRGRQLLISRLGGGR